MARRIIINTRLEIIEAATDMFLQNGYTNVTVAAISDRLNISKGNFTFYFPTKEHVLAELIIQLVSFQWDMLEQELGGGYSGILAYLFEDAAMACSCYEDEVAKDLYVSAYRSPLSLHIIRESDAKKAKNIFHEYCPDWDDADFALAENIASGIEYSMFTTEREQGIELDKKIRRSLHTILTLYNVPEDECKKILDAVFAMNYREMGKHLLEEFRVYVGEKNRCALEEAFRQKRATKKS